MSPGPVAIIDLGSNSIKILVAARAPDGGILPLHTRTIDARISAGISQTEPRLGEEGMMRGIDAVRSLLADAIGAAASRTMLVATSAVRDAQNGAEFRHRVRAATGQEIRILTGEEEANLIGRGLTTDSTLRGLRDFYVFDLGGGSLECLRFRGRSIEQAVSLRLGCVRLTEKFVVDPTQSFSDAAEQLVAQHTREAVTQAGFAFSLSADAVAVGTGGTVNTARAILAAHGDKSLDEMDPMVTVPRLRELLRLLGALPLDDRKKIPGLPPARADVFPVALATLIAVAELGGFTSFRHSICNLRYGLADETLG
ncbi:MAG: phosphatase [Opitutus sp.]|nr:phosphatase [Opitutus sp.]